MNYQTIIRISICFGLIIGLVGCAAQTSSLRTDAEMEQAQQDAQDRTLERLTHSNSHDIADQACLLAGKLNCK